MLQLVIENAGALALLVGAVAGLIKAIADAVDKISGAIAKVAPLFSGQANHRARRLERAKHGTR